MDFKDLSKIDVNQLLKNKNILANIGIIILALIITVNLHKSQAQKINILKNKISQENETTALLSSIKTLEDEVDSLKKDLPVDLSSNIVIDKISTIAGKRNIRIASIDSQSAVDKELYLLLPVRLDIKTGYHGLGHFVSDIEQTGMFKVKRLNIKGGKTYSSKTDESSFALELVAVTLKK